MTQRTAIAGDRTVLSDARGDFLRFQEPIKMERLHEIGPLMQHAMNPDQLIPDPQ
jgi:hypothetical protein